MPSTWNSPPPAMTPGPVSSPIAAICDELAEDPLFGGDSAAELLDIADQCREPLRVAVAGDVSTGKSTLVNALLAAQRAAVAHRETTSRVTSYRHPGLPPPRSPAPGHEYEPVPFPCCDRLIVIDTPGLNSPSGKEQVTQDMITGATRAAGATSVLLYLCKDCVVSKGALNHIEAFASLTAGRIGWGLNVVLVGAKADSIEASRDALAENLRSEARIPCADSVAVSQLCAMVARTGLLDDSLLELLRIIGLDDGLLARVELGWTSLRRGWVARGYDPVAIDRLSEMAESPGVLQFCLSEFRDGRIRELSDLRRAWERYSGIVTLDRMVRRFTDDADMYTAYSATGRMRRLALRLGPERGKVLRGRLAGIEKSGAYSALVRREAAAIITSPALSYVPEADRIEAAEMLRDPAPRPSPSLARAWQRIALVARSSLARQTADIVIEASLNPRPRKGIVL